MLSNINHHNFIIKRSDLTALMLVMAEEEIYKFKMTLMRIRAEEVMFRSTKNTEELIIIVGGSGGITINGEGALIKSGDIIYIPKNTIRSVANINQEALLEVILITAIRVFS
jgi:mannose-6-phosphate isomerase-like protein (cupin superfamily)